MKKLNIKIPESWNELTDRQLCLMSKLFYITASGQKAIELFDVDVWLILMDGHKRDAYIVLQDVPISELKKHFEFIYKEYNRTVFIKEVKAGVLTYHAPMDRLTNLSAEEFAAAEDLHKLWGEKKDREVLEYLAAVLYTDKPVIRPKFEKLLLEQKAKLFSEVPLEFLLAMEMTYTGCKSALVKRFPKAFPKGNPGTNQKKGPGFGEVILNMAGGKFGTHKETAGTNIYTFLAEFENNLKKK